MKDGYTREEVQQLIDAIKEVRGCIKGVEGVHMITLLFIYILIKTSWENDEGEKCYHFQDISFLLVFIVFIYLDYEVLATIRSLIG